MLEKEKILNAVQEMPSNVDLEALFEKLIFIQKVEQGLADVAAGNVISSEDLKEEVKKWGR